MPSSAPLPYEESPEADHGWPQPRELRPPPPVGRPPSPRRRRSRLGSIWVLFAVIGVALAAVAGLWYLKIDRSGPPAKLTVPKVVGLKESAAIHRLRTIGFAVRSVEMPASGKVGVVFRQRPAAAATLTRGDTVTVYVASGK